MAWVEVESEFFPLPKRLNRTCGGLDIIGNLCWMHFHCKTDSVSGESVQDVVESFCKNLPGLFIFLFVGRRPRIPFVPHVRAAEPNYDANAQLVRRLGGAFEPFHSIADFVIRFRRRCP